MTTTRRTLVVTNDFPPRQGGIQSFVENLLARQPAESIVVYASTYPGADAFDATRPYPVIRHGTGLLVPTPTVRARVAALAREYECRSAWFGAAAPLALLAPALREAGVERVVASTHGHEVGWAALPGARQLLARVADGCDVVTYIADYTRRRLEPVIGRRTELVRLSPGVDVEQFTPDVSGDAVRRRYGLLGRPLIVCVSRLVPRKGQDALIRALPLLRHAVPGVALVLVGSGPYERRLRALSAELNVADDVVFTGGVAPGALPEYYAAADVFSMPCRTRRGGLDVEGLGMVYLEAAAAGRPVVGGDSGGAPDAMLPGVTGFVVDGRDEEALEYRLRQLLLDPALRARLGASGRDWVVREWQWPALAERLRNLLNG